MIVQYTEYPTFREDDLAWTGFHTIETDYGSVVITANVSDRGAYHTIFDCLSKAYSADGKFILVTRDAMRKKFVKIIFHSVTTEKDGLKLLLIVEEIK